MSTPTPTPTPTPANPDGAQQPEAGDPSARSKPARDPNAPQKKLGRPTKEETMKRKRMLQKNNASPGADREESPTKQRKGINGVAHPAIPDTPSRFTHSIRARDFTEESTRRIDLTAHAGIAPTTATKDTLIPGIAPELASPFVSITASFKVTIPPIASLYPLEGALAHYISPLLLTWHDQLSGILLSYNNAKLHTTPPLHPAQHKQREDDQQDRPMAEAKDECAAPYVWLTLDCLVFQPKKGIEMEGFLSLSSESQITLILWNFFTVTISSKLLPKGWTWHPAFDAEGNVQFNQYQGREGEHGEEDEDTRFGHWTDQNQQPVKGFIRFKIKDWDCAPPGSDGEGSFLSIYGSMLTEEEEQAYETTKKERRASWHRKLLNEAAGTGANGRGGSRSGTPTRGILKGSIVTPGGKKKK